MTQRFGRQTLENNNKSRQLNLPFSEADLLDDLTEDTAHSGDLAEPQPNEIEPSSAEKSKPELLRLIEEANETNRRNVRFAMDEFGKKLYDLSRGIPMKREPNALREVNRADGTVEFIPVKI